MASAPPLQNDSLVQGTAPEKVAQLGVLSEGYCPDGKAEDAGDQRVSVVPEVAASLMKDGYIVNVQQGAGVYAGFSDEAFEKVGCKVMSRSDVISKSDVLFQIKPPTSAFEAMKGKVIVSWVRRLQKKQLVEQANNAGVTLVDVTAVPRITLATITNGEELDVVMSQSVTAGLWAVIEAMRSRGCFHTAEMTAAGKEATQCLLEPSSNACGMVFAELNRNSKAGKYPPSHTFVLGCGAAGVAAIVTSRALGSVVKAWDVRDVSDQCQSMGAKWVHVDFKEDGAGAGGYAKESSETFKKAQQDTFRKVLQDTDIAITAAAIPGRRCPLLITKEAVAGMKPGSVIVDLGLNCELTRLNETYVTPNGVTIMVYSDLLARMAMQSSATYAKNMANLLRHVHAKEKAQGLLKNMHAHLAAGESGDIVTRSIVCCAGGKKIPMPPPPPPPPPPQPTPEPSRQACVISLLVLCVAVHSWCSLGVGVKNSLLITFLLAGVAGCQAYLGVAHALQPLLMYVTECLSQLNALGGLFLMSSSELYSAPWAVAAVAMLVTAVIFFVSQGMLDLFLDFFKHEGEKDHSVLLMLAPALIFFAVSATHPELMRVSVVSAIGCVAVISVLTSNEADRKWRCKLNFGILGLFVALVATMMPISSRNLYWALGLLAVGGVGGLVVGKKVSPIAVAAFHSLVGLAAMSTSIGSFWAAPEAGVTLENVSAILGDFIGGVTLTGSIIAFGKLNGNLSSKPLSLPGKNFLNLSGLVGFIALTRVFLQRGSGDFGVLLLFIVAILACAMGVHLVGSVGGGDMPVCITVLNSYSGLALVAEGFLLGSTVLTIIGSLIGFSGGILTKIMCDAMNRDIFNVLFGGINNKPVAKMGDTAPKEHTETSVPAVAQMLVDAKEVLIVPGYGMAMARAQGAIGELANLCRNNNIHVKFGIHPVAGRMPGQMNVLLAKAGVPQEWVLEMGEVNPEMENNDVVLVVGANDVVNSAAQGVEGCAIWGMPLIEVWRSKKVIFCKRSMGGGYADLDNPVFYKDNTEMLLGDAKKTADSLAAKVRELLERV